MLTVCYSRHQRAWWLLRAETHECKRDCLGTTQPDWSHTTNGEQSRVVGKSRHGCIINATSVTEKYSSSPLQNHLASNSAQYIGLSPSSLKKVKSNKVITSSPINSEMIADGSSAFLGWLAPVSCFRNKRNDRIPPAIFRRSPHRHMSILALNFLNLWLCTQCGRRIYRNQGSVHYEMVLCT